MNITSRQLRITRTFDAPVELVWEMWTKPEHLAQWWGPNGFTTTIHQMNAKKGEEWRLTMHSPDGQNFPNRSIFQEVILYEKIVFEHFNPDFITTVIFEARGEKTFMQWTMVFESTEMLEAVVKAHKADKGLEQNAEKLQDYLSTIKTGKMNSNLLFDFTVNRENNTIHIKRTFNAPLELVWEAWTTPEILEQWIAPKPWRAETKTMDFREGGFWLYAMISPQNEKHWSRYDYQKIEHQKSITELRAFSDENGAVTPDFPRTLCTNNFSEMEGKTLVTVTARYGSREVLEYMVTHGFKEGLASSLENLDKVLLIIKNKKK